MAHSAPKVTRHDWSQPIGHHYSWLPAPAPPGEAENPVCEEICAAWANKTCRSSPSSLADINTCAGVFAFARLYIHHHQQQSAPVYCSPMRCSHHSTGCGHVARQAVAVTRKQIDHRQHRHRLSLAHASGRALMLLPDIYMAAYIISTTSPGERFDEHHARARSPLQQRRREGTERALPYARAQYRRLRRTSSSVERVRNSSPESRPARGWRARARKAFRARCSSQGQG